MQKPSGCEAKPPATCLCCSALSPQDPPPRIPPMLDVPSGGEVASPESSAGGSRTDRQAACLASPRGAGSPDLLAALFLNVPPAKLWLIETVCADPAVLGHLAARALPAAPGSPALLHRRLLGGLVPGHGLHGPGGRCQRLSILGPGNGGLVCHTKAQRLVHRPASVLQAQHFPHGGTGWGGVG